jgi:transcriptional regulator with XRE-family HTH domain
MDIGLKLRELRRLRGLTQVMAVQRAGITRWHSEKTLSAIESGTQTQRLRVADLEKFLRLYGVTLEEFFSDEFEILLENNAFEMPKYTPDHKHIPS